MAGLVLYLEVQCSAQDRVQWTLSPYWPLGCLPFRVKEKGKIALGCCSVMVLAVQNGESQSSFSISERGMRASRRGGGATWWRRTGARGLGGTAPMGRRVLRCRNGVPAPRCPSRMQPSFSPRKCIISPRSWRDAVLQVKPSVWDAVEWSCKVLERNSCAGAGRADRG